MSSVTALIFMIPPDGVAVVDIEVSAHPAAEGAVILNPGSVADPISSPISIYPAIVASSPVFE